MLHRAEPGQEAPALLVVAEAVDHPGGHVVDRDVGRRAGAGRRQLLHDQGRIEAARARCRRRRPAHRCRRSPAPPPRAALASGKIFSASQRAASGSMRVGRELPRRVAEGLLVLGEGEIHARADHIGGSCPVKQAALPAARGSRHNRRPWRTRFSTLGAIRHAAAPQPPRGLVAPAGGRDQALGRRPDLAGVRAGGQERAHAGRVRCRASIG